MEVSEDIAGNTNEASTSVDNSVLFDSISPSVTINQAAAQPDPTNQFPILYTVGFNEPVTGFDASDVVMDGTATGITYHIIIHTLRLILLSTYN